MNFANGLMTSVWQFLLLREALLLLNDCVGPLCGMLKAVARDPGDTTGPFTECDELVRLLEYSPSDVADLDAHYGLPTVARIQLALSAIKPHNEVAASCEVGASASKRPT